MGVSLNEFYRLQKEGRLKPDVTPAQINTLPIEKRSSLLDDSWWFRTFPNFFTGNGANVSVTPINAMGLTAYRRCVELRGTGIASLKLRLIENSSGKKEVVKSHPVLDVIRRPNPYMTEYNWRLWMESVKVGRGNSYSYILRDGNGRPTQLIPIWNPDSMIPYLQNGELWYSFSGINYSVEYGNFNSNLPTKIPAIDVIHFKGITWDNPLRGISPIHYHAERLGMAIAAEKSGSTTYKDNRVKFAISSSENIKPEQQVMLKQTLTDVLNGDSDSLVLPPNGKIEQMSLSPKDAEFIANSNLTVQEIGRIFGVPNSMLNLDGSTKGSTEQEYINFYSNTLYPDSISNEQELAYKLFAEREKSFMSFDHIFNSTKMADATTRADVYEKQRRMGVINAEWIAETEELPTPENGNLYFTDANLVPVSQFEAWIDSKIQQNLSKQNPNPNGNN